MRKAPSRVMDLGGVNPMTIQVTRSCNRASRVGLNEFHFAKTGGITRQENNVEKKVKKRKEEEILALADIVPRSN